MKYTQPTQEVSAPSNDEIRRLLRRRAQQTGKSLRWNRNILLLTYAVLAATTIVALKVGSAAFAAIVAVPGLAIVWGFSLIQSKRLEKEIFEDELQAYKELLSESQRPVGPSALQPRATALADSPLSDRELEVLAQIALGKSNKQAALELYISEQTVKNHLKHIFTKLEVRDRTSAIVMAMKNGWIKSQDPTAKNQEPLEDNSAH
jgi:DNA-binding CsgD family transcriptional regulator